LIFFFFIFLPGIESGVVGGSGVVNEFESPEFERLVVVTVGAGVILPLLLLEPPLVGLISALITH
jgi:hypothetical protein